MLVVPEGLSGSAYWVERHDAGLRYCNAWLVDGYRRFQRDGGWEPDGLAIPLYMPLVGVAAVTFMIWWRDHRRTQPGLCASCGYDLTGNVTRRCSECGSEVQDAYSG